MRRTALRRRTPMRRTPMRRGKHRSKYARRERDVPFMLFVKTLACSVRVEPPDPTRKPTRCSGPIEADHDSRGRGISQKSHDRTCIPMCKGHHGERTDHSWSFKHLVRDQIREWFSRAQERVARLWAEASKLGATV